MSEDEHRGFDDQPAAPAFPTIDAALARRLIDAQFPQWAGLPVGSVAVGGVDNRTFHLGDAMTVRLPSGPGYDGQVDKEQRWLPSLAAHLPLPIPAPVAKGVPGEGYPLNWSVYRWIKGETASDESIGDLTEFATDLAGFLVALQRIDPADGPPPARHAGFRGGPLTTYDDETRRTIEALGDRIAGEAAAEAWETALRATWNDKPVWFHGDIASGNLLVRDGRLAAVIDFGCSGVGDPACDTVIAWTLLSGESRQAFRDALSVDPATWARGRGWALWKALITYAEGLDGDPGKAAAAKRVLDEVLREYEQSA
ncbi:aminoglycoside phosphotransferase family protein [Streptomyces sp. NPDC126933]|uniref:aminoglycoside phosphotransferase family protein n=1 Tax=unclassified Streptomyces TaxID=2593676 RepID=UPI0036481285